MQHFPTVYELIAVMFLILTIFALMFYVLVCRLSELEKDLGRLRRHEASRRSRELRWLKRPKESALLRANGTEESVVYKRSQ